ncbi:MFS transporter [Pseudonocardia sp. CA-107938]|uniref:MFS transporter n=1 Tax=Pseudonocardia sp. CA-107938 TaxID=3240021 RepID=UPI003D92B3D7
MCETEKQLEHDLAVGLRTELAGAVESPPATARMEGTLGLGIAIVLVALNLRPAVTSVSAVLEDVRTALSAPSIWTSALTTVPTLCFALIGFTAPRIVRRLGSSRTVSLAVGLLALGLLLRPLGDAWLFVGATALACTGIAIANVLLPAVVKDSFPLRIGLMTALFTSAMQGGGAAAAMGGVPLAALMGGWRGALAMWGGLAVLALLFWLATARHTPNDGRARPDGVRPAVPIARSRVARRVTLLMGTQSLVAYVVMEWMPQVFVGAGSSAAYGALMLAITTAVAVPFSMVVPALAVKQPNQGWWIAALTVCGLAGVLGLLTDPLGPSWLWAVLIGVSLTVFSVDLAVISLRAGNAQVAASLSAMAQGGGYLIASVGPFLFGLLHDWTGSWTVSLVTLLVVLAGQLAVGFLAGRESQVGEPGDLRGWAVGW